MNKIVASMVEKYDCKSTRDYINALREILQEVALLGLWRSKFFEKAAFYGGTALRILYGLDRFSEDIDFSLIKPNSSFNLNSYLKSLETELSSFGFNVSTEEYNKSIETDIRSAFIKANTVNQLLIIEANDEIIQNLPKGQLLKIKIEIDTNPPLGFNTEMKYIFKPIPFAVRTYVLSDLFAGKIHALLFRNWKNRVKGRDWYDFIWYISNGTPELNLSHLEQRMRQGGQWNYDYSLNEKSFNTLLNNKIEELNVQNAIKDVEPFLKNNDNITLWSKDFFHEAAKQIKII